jgi:predicted  nucleic acid-binding Zn-ribbon protein
MTSTRRRRVLRPVASTSTVVSAQLSRWRGRLAEEQQALSRWMTRLKRAFHSLEKHQQRVARLERQIRQVEET